MKHLRTLKNYPQHLREVNINSTKVYKEGARLSKKICHDHGWGNVK